TPATTTTASTARGRKSRSGGGAIRSTACAATWKSRVSTTRPRMRRCAPRSAGRLRTRRAAPKLPPRPTRPHCCATSMLRRPMPVQTYLEAIRGAMFDEMARDERVIVLGEDVGLRGGVFGATRGLLEAYGAERVIDTPLAEVGIAGVAIGAAANGLRPVAEMQFADYIHPAFDQLVNEASRVRYRSNGAWGCPLVIRAPFGGGVHGGLYHSQSAEAFYCHVPGLKVVVPSTPADARGLLLAAIRDPDPVIYFEHKGAYRRLRGEVPTTADALPLGVAAVARPGKHLTAVAYGLMVHTCLEAAAQVAEEGVEAEVLDLRTLSPLDR